MAVKVKLRKPKSLAIDFKPSQRQYELWKNLQPECPKCGGEVYIDETNPDNLTSVCRGCGNSNIPRVTLGGGAAGGGKSYLASVWIVTSCIRFDGIKAAIGRKTLKSIKASTLATLLSVLRDWNLEEDVHYHYNSNSGIITFWNNSSISLVEMATTPSDPNFERYGSSEYTIAAVDEVSEIDEKAVEVLASRLRWKLGNSFIVPKMLLTTNPCTNWVRDRFVQDENGDPAKLQIGDAYIPFTVDDNPDKEFVATYKSSLQKIRDVAQRERLLLGNWDFVDVSDAAFYSSFDGSKHLHTGLYERYYDKYDTLILGFDFNTNPYMSCLEFQIDYEKKKVFVLKEHAGMPSDKRNSTPAFSRYLANEYAKIDHRESYLITGDPSGTAEKTVAELGVNEYTHIEKAFSDEGLPNFKKLLTSQPPHKTRGDFINDVFDGIIDDWEIMIDLRCKKLINDLSYQLSNDKGGKDKSKVRDPKTLIKVEKYGHMSDIFDYVICLFLKKEFSKYNRSSGVTRVFTSYIAPAFNY